MKRQIKALVNGKIEIVAIESTYHNGFENMIEGKMEFNGVTVSVVVAESAVVEEIKAPKARLKAEYKGSSREWDELGEGRCVEFVATGKTREDVDRMFDMLDKYMSQEGYEMGRCEHAEEHKGEWTRTDSVVVEDPSDSKWVLELYKKFKKNIKEGLTI